MFHFKSSTNVRPSKSLGTQVIASPTLGTIKVTPNAASIMGVVVGDHFDIGVDTVSGSIFAVKVAEGGSKLACSNRSGNGMLTLSSVNAWDDLKGNTDENVHYDLAKEPMLVNAEGVEVAYEAGQELGEGVTAYFLLTLDKTVAKVVRRKAVKKVAIEAPAKVEPTAGLDAEDSAESVQGNEVETPQPVETVADILSTPVEVTAPTTESPFAGSADFDQM